MEKPAQLLCAEYVPTGRFMNSTRHSCSSAQRPFTDNMKPLVHLQDVMKNTKCCVCLISSYTSSILGFTFMLISCRTTLGNFHAWFYWLERVCMFFSSYLLMNVSFSVTSDHLEVKSHQHMNVWFCWVILVPHTEAEIKYFWHFIALCNIIKH